MKLAWEYISAEHKELIENFECQDESDVSLFLKEEALRFHLLNMARTRLYFDEDHNLVGYFTVYNDLMEFSNRQRRKHRYSLPARHRYYPALKLHYLGVDERHRNKKYGTYLLLETLTLAMQTSRSVGCVFLTLEAIKSAVPFYYHHDFKKLGKSHDNKYLNMFFKIDELL